MYHPNTSSCSQNSNNLLTFTILDDHFLDFSRTTPQNDEFKTIHYSR